MEREVGERRHAELLLKQREDRHVAARGVGRAGRQSAAQRGFLAVAEPTRDPQARRVARVGVDLHTLDAADVERRASQRRGRLGDEPAAKLVRPQPVADLQRGVANALVAPGAAYNLMLVRREHAVHILLTAIEVCAEATQALYHLA